MNLQPTGNATQMQPPAPPAQRPVDLNGAPSAAAALRQEVVRTNSGTETPVDPLMAVSASERAGSTEQVSREQVDKAVEDVQRFVESMNNGLKFSIDDGSGRTVVKVIDRQTEEVLRQIPSEEMLDIARALGKLKGLLVEQKA